MAKIAALSPLGLSLAAVVLASCFPAGVSAQTADAPSPYLPGNTLIPLPPPDTGIEPTFEIGTRVWASEGKTSFSINSHKIDPALGNPTSTLDYDGMDAVSAEFTFRAHNETNTFTKGFIGGGGLFNGSLDDRDFFVGQTKFSDTGSRLEGNGIGYGTIDLGQEFRVIDDDSKRVSVNPFIGFNFYQQSVNAFGARCKPDDVGGAVCGPPGSIEVPFSTKGINDIANWASLRLGTEVKASFPNHWTLIGDAAVLPVAYLWNDDSHFLREDLGPVPNIKDTGTGWGYQLEGEARYDFANCWSLGAGVRYWFMSTDGKSEFVHLGAVSRLEDFESQRFGVFGDLSYRFMTF